jgi:predicted dehydrogenase
VDPLRVGVVGLGKMGRHHLRCIGLAHGVTLAGAMDRDPARGVDLPDGASFTTDLGALLDSCDAAVVAVPTDAHEEVALACLERRVPVLVEKPLAPTAAACRRLEQASRRLGVRLGVGHVERHNGAILETRERIRAVRFVEGHRLAGFDPRGTEVDVVLDLMIHDLDLVLSFVREDPNRVEAVGVAIASGRIDLANARLEFPSGAIANLTASRVSRSPVRKLRIFQPDSYLSLDLGTQSAEILSREPRAVPFGVAMERISAPEGHNPLVRELEDFAAAIRGAPNALVEAPEAARSVALAETIAAEIAERRRAWDAASSS